MADEPESSPTISPDIAEQELGDEIDDAIPTRGFHTLPIVGLGGSAGSISALQNFFAVMPAASGMGFIVILHLPPDHESQLANVLQRCTSMPVREAEDGQHVESNHVYIIPPGKHLTMSNGQLRLAPLNHSRGKRVAIDLFFRTLADTHGPHAVAVVLSGKDGDGTIGIKRIKERGGLTITQDPTEAESPEMPESAISTGMVDWILPVAEIPRRLAEYQGREKRLRLPPEEGPPPSTEHPHATNGEGELREVLVFLKTRTGRDFSCYKRATILRRISRRMRVNELEDLREYLAYLRTHPGEAETLLQDLLISVTNFFRDRDYFEKLQQTIGNLFRGKGLNDAVRVWVPACATGEEAYSISMLLHEHAAKITDAPAIQIFATDLDGHAIQTARTGLYLESIAADVSEERLHRFFTREHNGYRVKRDLRESVLFAVHDLLRDSPFSRTDLISCRNLLIYLNRAAQTRVFSIFHFALNKDGCLFLGSSDSVEDGSQLFSVVDKKARLFAPRPVARASLPAPIITTAPQHALSLHERGKEKQVVLSKWGPALKHALVVGLGQDPQENQAMAWSELHFRLVEYFAPPSVIVDADYEIMHLSENARRFLQFSGGEPTRNLLQVVNPVLRIELRAALYRAAQTQEPTQTAPVVMPMEKESHLVTVRVSPAPNIAPQFFLVVFESGNAAQNDDTDRSLVADNDAATQQIERELEGVNAHMRVVVEQYEASTEELKASNEELQAINEELRSATEELETSREELQSINEELTTVNSELKSNVDELALANSDLRNLMASTAIAIVFLDRDQRITRFTPPAVEIFNLIPTDLGRPLADLSNRLDYPELKEDADRVLKELTPVEREVSLQGKAWYLARILPYRTTDDHIGGLVLTFVDITERRQNESETREAALRLSRSEERLQTLFGLIPASIYSCDAEGRIDFYNPHAASLWGGPPDPQTKFSGFKTLYDESGAPLAREQSPMAQSLHNGKLIRYVEIMAENVAGKHFCISENIAPIRAPDGRVIGAINVFLDVTGQKEVQKALRDTKDNLENANIDLEKKVSERTKKLNETIGELEAFSFTLAHDMRAPLRAIQGFAELLITEKGSGLSPATESEYLTRIKTASDRLDRLIQEVLNYSRFIRQELKLEPVDTGKLLQEIMDSYPNLQKHAKEIKVKTPLPVVSGNTAALTLVLSNLLGNALKFVKPGCKPEVIIRAEEIGSKARIWVQDDGIGIEESAQEKIFELFQQISPGSYEGAGVGLAVVRKAVERMSGKIGVKSALDCGSSFWVELNKA